MTDEIKIPIAELRASLHCASTDKTRYYLCGVCLDRGADGSTLLITTNGHVMSVTRIDGELPKQFIGRVLSAEAILTAWKLIPGRAREEAQITVSECGTLALEERSIKIDSGFIPGATYPDWRHVFPRGPYSERTSSCIISQQLEQLAQAARKDVLRLFAKEGDDQEAMLVMSSRPDWRGVLMPMRPVIAGASCPDWI